MAEDLTDPAAFKAEFPEFAPADDALVRAKLSDALEWCDPIAYGPLLKQGVYYGAAQLLAKSPSSRDMKLSTTDGKTIYDAVVDRLKRQVTAGYRVCT